MAKLLAAPLLACLLTFASGCLGDSSPVAEARDMVPPPAGESPGPAPGAPAPAAATVPPECPEGGSNNYGTSTEVAGHYVVSPVGGNLVVYYQESNGCNGMQTEEAWAHNPDTKVAEIPNVGDRVRQA